MPDNSNLVAREATIALTVVRSIGYARSRQPNSKGSNSCIDSHPLLVMQDNSLLTAREATLALAVVRPIGYAR